MAKQTKQLNLIVSAAVAGESWAFESILDMYGKRLYGFFLRMTCDTDSASDLLGELSLKLVRSMARYREQDRFENWLFTMAANLARDRIRRLKAAPNTISIHADENSGEKANMPELASDAESPSQPMEMAERATALHQALGQLDSETREMIMMRHFGEMSFAEIASSVNKPLGTVLARVHRGLRKLRTTLEPVIDAKP